MKSCSARYLCRWRGSARLSTMDRPPRLSSFCGVGVKDFGVAVVSIIFSLCARCVAADCAVMDLPWSGRHYNRKTTPRRADMSKLAAGAGNVNTGALIVCSVAWVLCSAFPPPAHAQDYPTKPIRVVIAGGAGSSPDIIARLLGNKVAAALGRPFVMDPRPGASGGIGAEIAARSAPDGYTLFMLTSQLTSASAMYTKL